MDFDWNCLLGKFQSSHLLGKFQPSQLVCTPVRDVKLDAQEKLFVLTIFSRFVGLCKVSVR